jgi:RNA polymerase sigma-70 factor (ECF subfamily)
MEGMFAGLRVSKAELVPGRAVRPPSIACFVARSAREPAATRGLGFRAATPAVEPDITNVADVVLVRAALAGDVRAPREIWRRFAPLVQRIVNRGLGRDDDVEDIVQNIFMTLFEKLPALRDPEALRAFLVSISARTVRYELRRRRNRRLLVLSPSPELMEAGVVSADTDSRQALHRLRVLLDRLTAREREAFVLRFIGLDLEETAEALNVSIPTIRRALSRACERLSILARADGFLMPYLGVARTHA